MGLADEKKFSVSCGYAERFWRELRELEIVLS